ncbi:MAG TPA: hypothetical protein VK802_17005, partial [Streptosporangiaceae bacterium]|nr:hypothetical protein [Streptosporangiaceae bacterium]
MFPRRRYLRLSRAQTAFASAACFRDFSVDETGKNRSGSADRQAASTCQFHSAGRVSPGAVQGVAVSCGPRHRVVAPSLIPPRYLVASSCAAGVYRGMVHGPGGWG